MLWLNNSVRNLFRKNNGGMESLSRESLQKGVPVLIQGRLRLCGRLVLYCRGTGDCLLRLDAEDLWVLAAGIFRCPSRVLLVGMEFFYSTCQVCGCNLQPFPEQVVVIVILLSGPNDRQFLREEHKNGADGNLPVCNHWLLYQDNWLWTWI
jgi:hypothetical protein